MLTPPSLLVAKSIFLLSWSTWVCFLSTRALFLMISASDREISLLCCCIAPFCSSKPCCSLLRRDVTSDICSSVSAVTLSRSANVLSYSYVVRKGDSKDVAYTNTTNGWLKENPAPHPPLLPPTPGDYNHALISFSNPLSPPPPPPPQVT